MKNNAACGYLYKEYLEAKQLMMDVNRENPYGFITIRDLLGETRVLSDFHESESRGSELHRQQYLQRLHDNTSTLNDFKDLYEKIANSYVQSRNSLSCDGRDLFKMSCAANGMLIYAWQIVLNSQYLMNVFWSPTFILFVFTRVSLDLFIDDIMRL